MLSEYLLGFAAERYGFDKESCGLLTQGREKSKQLCSFELNRRQYVLRLVKCNKDYTSRTEAEMDWLCFLADSGVGVPLPLKTADGKLAVSAEDGGETYIISVFSKAAGRQWDWPANAGLGRRGQASLSSWDIQVLRNWGRAVGEMHRATQTYKPAYGASKRGEFGIRGMIGKKIAALPCVSKTAEALLNEIEALPKDSASYGLIHNDLHPNNMLIDGERVNLVDFDGCAYSWYAFDIGTALFLTVWLGPGAEFANDIARYFLEGYLSANNLSGFWLSKIPLFMMACKIALFSRGCDCESFGGEFSEARQREQIFNIENNILFEGYKPDRRFLRYKADI